MPERTHELVGNRLLYGIDNLLLAEKTLIFNETGLVSYAVFYDREKPDMPYCLNIEIDGNDVYTEHFLKLEHLVEQEPLDLSRFTIN
jgi:hypothetical protein